MKAISLSTLPLLLVAGTYSANTQTPRFLPQHSDQGTRPMEVTRKADMKTIDGPADWFTGKVTITGQFQRSETSRVGGAIVHLSRAHALLGTSIRLVRR